VSDNCYYSHGSKTGFMFFKLHSYTIHKLNIFVGPKNATILTCTQPPIHWVAGKLKQPGHEADNSPPSNAEV